MYSDIKIVSISAKLIVAMFSSNKYASYLVKYWGLPEDSRVINVDFDVMSGVMRMYVLSNKWDFPGKDIYLSDSAYTDEYIQAKAYELNGETGELL
jgi:hypothetical protein